MDVLNYDCQECRAKAGEKCRNYKGGGKTPCKSRGQPTPKKGRRRNALPSVVQPTLYDLLD